MAVRATVCTYVLLAQNCARVKHVQVWDLDESDDPHWPLALRLQRNAATRVAYNHRRIVKNRLSSLLIHGGPRDALIGCRRLGSPNGSREGNQNLLGFNNGH